MFCMQCIVYINWFSSEGDEFLRGSAPTGFAFAHPTASKWALKLKVEITYLATKGKLWIVQAASAKSSGPSFLFAYNFYSNLFRRIPHGISQAVPPAPPSRWGGGSWVAPPGPVGQETPWLMFVDGTSCQMKRGTFFGKISSRIAGSVLSPPKYPTHNEEPP